MKYARFLFVMYLALGVSFSALAQDGKAPVARFSFNDGKGYEDFSKRRIKLVGANFTRDRFGNDNHAVYLAGNPESYINLGTDPVLKPIKGSISLWIYLEFETALGRGGMINPIILTKCARRDDYYEAYFMYYVMESDRIEAGSSRDSLKQATIFSSGSFSRYKWHHLVVTYDNDFIDFYMDGVSLGQASKRFETQFDPMDSVVVGTTANIKNARSMNGIVDDIEFYDRVLAPAEVLELYNAPNPNRNKVILYWLLAMAALFILVILIYFVIRHRLGITLKKERQRFELYNIVLETELRVNRALMNPHFVFNSLNALQNFILKNENASANNYLVKFSKLMRRILESNMSDVITLEFEVQLLNSYLEIENLRFEEFIHYEIVLEPAITPSHVNIPIMMIQPFVENAIWHGLLTKRGEKLLQISFSLVSATYLLCRIEDNGMGRRKKENADSDKSSLATGFIEQRLGLLNKIHQLNCTLTIIDKPGMSGTIVEILLPILKK